MADHNTRKLVTDRLKDAVLCLTTNHTELSLKMDSILDWLFTLSTSSPSPAPSPIPISHKPLIKLDVPCFDDHDPLGWIFKIYQFFDYHGTLDEECITISSFYVDDPVLSWYQRMYRKSFITSWPGLLQALESCFNPSFYDNPKGAFFKLSQHGTVNEYLTEFERLANRIVGLAPPFLLSCFVSGLSSEL